MSDALTHCQSCTHYEQKEALTFYCKLHDAVYNISQDDCEDLEEKEHYESTSYECD